MEKVRSDDQWEFFSSQRTLFLMMLGVHPEIQAPWKQVCPTGNFFPPWYKLVSSDLLWVNTLKRLFSSESLKSYREQTKLIRNISPSSFHAVWDISARPKLTESSFSPSEFPILWNPPGTALRATSPARGTGARASLQSFISAPWKLHTKGWTLTSPGRWAGTYKTLHSSPTPHTGAGKHKGKRKVRAEAPVGSPLASPCQGFNPNHASMLH